jgi:hypothetical protein
VFNSDWTAPCTLESRKLRITGKVSLRSRVKCLGSRRDFSINSLEDRWRASALIIFA